MWKPTLIGALAAIVGKQHVLGDPVDRKLYGYDATPFAPLVMPDAVVLPGCADEIARIVKLANQEKFPLVPRGAGTNLTGGARPIQGGVVLSTQRMNRIIELDADNLQVVVQPGVVTGQLQAFLEGKGLFYPPDPQSKDTCTIGGNLSENAGGPRAVKYGVTRQYVLALQCVLPDGSLVRLGARTMKSVVGFDLVSLLVGAEGMLGVITEATLRLLPLPACRGTLLVSFARMETAGAAVAELFRDKLLPAAIEFMDRATLDCVRLAHPGVLPENVDAVLVVEVDGSREEVERLTPRVAAVMERLGSATCRWTLDPKESESLWKARRAVSPALGRIAPLKLNEDIVVPISRLPEAIRRIHEIGQKHRVTCACFGHIGDGNIHVNFLVQPTEEERKRAELAVAELFELVISFGGSMSGEHGIGTAKQPFIELELSPPVLEAMRQIKRAWDPNDIMNPGKVFPVPAGDRRVRVPGGA